LKSDRDHIRCVEQAAALLSSQMGDVPKTAIVLGTGLSGLTDSLSVERSWEFTHLPGFPRLTVASHPGRLIKADMDGSPVLVLDGRAHIYEGYDAKEVTVPMRVLGSLGVEQVILTNACGSMNPASISGDIVLLEDHINLMGVNPLEGPNHDDWGPRFPDMSDPYDGALRHMARTVASEEGIALREGVYVAVVGPNLETRAEYRMLSRMGADVVGMSTVPEVLVARHMGMRVLAFAVVTDECDPDNLSPISIDDVLAAAAQASGPLERLVRKIVPRM